jgi:DNA-binding transcriptional ArsR family regulator
MNAPRLAEIGSLVGDQARANILSQLMDGRALTATELGFAAGVSAQTTSGHLAKLTASGLLAVTKQGRHRYYRLATPHVARMIEHIMVVAGDKPARIPMHGARQEAVRTARTCYDHLAGRLGVGIADVLLARKYLVLAADGGEVTRAGVRFLDKLGVEPEAVSGRRPFCRTCLDWTERRPHLAGKLGTALAARFFERRWLERQAGSRALTVTPAGRRMLRELFGLTL